MTRRLRGILALAGLVAAACVAHRPPAAPAAPIDRTALAARVRDEFLFAWHAYQRFASGHDELNPVSRTPHDWYPPAVFEMTPIDAVDTMAIMGLTTEAAEARTTILDHLSFDVDVSVQVFEVNIRILGALLTQYQTTGDARFLDLAQDLGRRLLPAFRSPTGMPYRFVNLRTGATGGPVSNPAEVGTLILEFGTLSKITGQPEFYDAAKRALLELAHRRDPATGLVGSAIDVRTGAWTDTSSHIGGGIDSYYEYALKCQRLFGDADCATIWRDGIAAVNRYLADAGPGGLWYGVADMRTGRRTATIYGSLQAFFPAVLALGGDVPRAERLQDSGDRMWQLNGVEPEELDYRTMRVTDARYELRPEIIESAYYLLHDTHDPKYLEMGRTFLDGLVACCRTDTGYTTLTDVRTKAKGDRQHSFLLAETFKYLYLIFQPDAVDFDRVTFNTEAHPLTRTW